MSPEALHAALERALAVLIRAPDPWDRLEALLETSPPEVGRLLRHLDPVGLTVLAELALEARRARLLGGSPDARILRARDPDGFDARFRAYQREVPGAASFPEEEARLWDEWTRRDGGLHARAPR